MVRLRSKSSSIQELVKLGCNEDFIRCCAKYLAKPRKHARRLSIPTLNDVHVLFDAANRLERFCGEIPLFEISAGLAEFAPVGETVKALRFQGALANNFILVLQRSLNPNLRGFCVKALSDHVREKTGKPNWRRVTRLIEEFGGNLDETALRMLHFHFLKSPSSKIFD